MVEEWLTAHGLALEYNKTEAIILAGRRNLHPIEFRLGGDWLAPSQTVYNSAAATVLAKMPPMKLRALEQTKSYQGICNKKAREWLMQEWQAAWTSEKYGA